ncbi:phosphatidylinositol transfer protein csr1 [Coemansia guatemalensis]|uniref:Phosphatidylinositol transfer protein csr1 n=1 Tax=Coemansia guatemalensis TaxID=2761395 RepID=A0A9W8LUF1_9FUNG|nr:phosphatidylinositol transfer protein csr1 [Coemansia guatemalensis]
MTVPDIIDAQEQYKSGNKHTGGEVGCLDDYQEKALKELWIKLLGHFEAVDGKPITVGNSLVKTDALSAAGISTDDAAAIDNWYSSNQEKVKDIVYQSVRDKMYLEGKRDVIVPSTFKPLFGDSADSRHFYNAFWQASIRFNSPDSHLLAFLRVNKWNVNTAFDKLVHSINRRIDQEIDRLMWEGDRIQNCGITEKGLTIHVGCDRFGYPVSVVRVRLNAIRERCAADVERYASYTVEKAALMARNFGEHGLLVYDFTDFKIENVDTAFTKTIITIIGGLYPQTFSATLLFVNSWLFSGLWKIIRGWFDPAMAKRTMIVKDIKALETFIDRDQINTEMGGTMKHTHHYIFPTKEENAKMFDVEGRQAAEDAFSKAIDSFIQETKNWTSGAGPTSYNADSRAQAASAFDSAAGNLDQYIRARFMEERTQ